MGTETYNIVRAILVGFYRPDNEHTLQFTTVDEDFGQMGPYWLVTHHTWSYRDTSSNVTYDYDAATVTMAFPATVPGWYFDSREFEKHRGEVSGELRHFQ